jgi:vitamin B12 transporter
MLLFALLLILPVAKKANAIADSKTDKIDDMVVTGRKIEERLSGELAEFGHKLEIITAEDISAGGYTDVNQIFESLVPSLYVVSKSGRGDYLRMSLNGGDNKRVIFLIDGVRINNRLYGRGYLDTISVPMIDRIEILKNGEGLFYGTDGTSGAINIITKPVSSERHGSIGAGYGSHEAVQAYGLISETIGHNGFMVYGAYDGWDGYLPFRSEDYDRIEGAARKERGYSRNNMMTKYERNMDLGRGAALRASILRNGVEADYMRVDEDRAINDRTEYIGIVKWDHDINKDLSYYIKAYYHEWWTDYTRQGLDGTFVHNEALWGYQDWGLNVMSSWFPIEKNEVLFGIDYQNYWGKDEVVIIDSDHEEVWAGFISLRPHFNAVPELKTSFGGRYNQTGGNEKFVWNISAYSPLFGPTYGRAVASTNFRLANANELYVNEDDAIGNPNLKPEESTNVELALGASIDPLTAEISYYKSEITDMIGLDGDMVYNNSNDKMDLVSYEFQISTRAFNGLSFSASAIFTDAKKNSDGIQLSHIPESLYKGLLRYWSASRRFGGDFTFRYVGEVKGENYPEFGSANYGDYWNADLSCYIRFGKNLAHMMTLRADNLFDKDYASYGYGKATGSHGEDFLYYYRGTPASIMLSYKYEF